MLQACLNGGRDKAFHAATPLTPRELAADARAVVDDVDTHELAAQLAHEGQLAVDHLFAKVSHVQVHVLSMRSLKAAALFGWSALTGPERR